jgi:hypothetical protein
MLGRCESLLHRTSESKNEIRIHRWRCVGKAVRTRIFRIKSERELYFGACRKRHMSRGSRPLTVFRSTGTWRRYGGGC